MVMSKVLKLLNCTEISVHGFRSTFRDWAAEQTNYAREIIGQALARKLKNKTEAAYVKSTMPIQQWSFPYV
jgi:hypothetical protein